MWDKLLDRTVALSFDRTGFRRHARGFEDAPERALGRVLITGGTSGIGLAAATALAEKGAAVEVWGRNAEKGAAAADALGDRGAFRAVDLGDLEAVRDASADTPGDGLAAVVLCAGAMPRERTLTPQGHELVWASQVLGHLLLLRVLRGRGALAEDTRVLWVSSGGMYLQRLDLTDLRRANGYQRHTVYANAKRAQVVLSAMLADRWAPVPFAAMHPGWVETDAVRYSMPVFHALTRPLLRDAAQGADTIVWLVAAAAPWPTGRFWFDRAEAPAHRSAKTRESERERAALWAEVLRDTDRWLPYHR